LLVELTVAEMLRTKIALVVIALEDSIDAEASTIFTTLHETDELEVTSDEA
jgi:hypothetical protein